MKEKIKLVVFKEHTLGYILPDTPDKVYHLKASVIRGADWSMSKTFDYVDKPTDIRLATPKDFEDFRVSFEGFENSGDYEFDKFT